MRQLTSGHVRRLLLALALAGYGACCQGADTAERFEFLQIRMAVPVKIVVYAPDSTVATQASNAAYDRIRELDRALSDYDPDSELMTLCRTASIGTPAPVSADLAKVLSVAKDLSRATDGAFDVTVGPAVKLWRIARRKKTLPDKVALAAALQAVGNELLTVDETNRRVTLHRQGMQLDLGGIAKGYAADEALKVLQNRGLPIALVAVAGDIRAGDAPPNQPGWRVEVEDYSQAPQQEHPRLLLFLQNQAVSTSGDTYQYVEIDNVRYSHLIDPRTGIGLTSPRSVTVLAPTGIQADALASAVSVLGPAKGLELLETREKTAAFIVELGPDGKSRKVRSLRWDQIQKPLPTAG